MTWIQFLQEAVQLLVGAITGVATGIGQGLSTLVDSLAFTTTGEGSAATTTMSAFMSVILIFGGISLALGLSRWVVNLLSSLGARNR